LAELNEIDDIVGLDKITNVRHQMPNKSQNSGLDDQKDWILLSRLEFRNLWFGICLIIEICYLEFDQPLKRYAIALLPAAPVLSLPTFSGIWVYP
jgi:hypothetical protein